MLEFFDVKSWSEFWAIFMLLTGPYLMMFVGGIQLMKRFPQKRWQDTPRKAWVYLALLLAGFFLSMFGWLSLENVHEMELAINGALRT